MKLKTNITKDWWSWIRTNIDNGVDKTFIFNMLIENGFAYDSIKKQLKFEPDLKTFFCNDWKKWVMENLATNQNIDGLFKILLLHGFTYDAIVKELNYKPSIPLDELPNTLYNLNVRKHNESRKSKKVKTPNIDSAKKVINDNLDLFYLDNFVTKNECDHIITLINKTKKPSKLASPEQDNFFRTSDTCDLTALKDEVIRNVDQRICDLMKIDSSLSEPIQGQYYAESQEFKPHTDFFEEGELSKHAAILGQRTFTVMVYLNTTEKGGHTKFPLIGKQFAPKRGRAIIWNNLNSDYSPNQYSLHHAQKVQKGFKAIITKWFRLGHKTD